MDLQDLTILKVTNISNFEFNGKNGARFGGRDFLIPAGKSLLAPKSVAEHLAKHLAQAILLSRAPSTDASKTTFNALWSEETIAELVKEILSDAYTEEKPVAKTQDELLADKIAELNKEIAPETPDEEDKSVPVIATEDGKIAYKDKAQVIAELTKRGITFDPRATKASLEKLLN